MKKDNKNIINNPYDMSNKCLKCGAKSTIGDCFECRIQIEFQNQRSKYIRK